MIKYFTLLLLCLAVSVTTWAQLSITVPTNGATNQPVTNLTVRTHATSTGNSDQDPDIFYVEISSVPEFDGTGDYQSSLDYERIVDTPEDIDNIFTGLLNGTLYYARAYSYKCDCYSSTITFTTVGGSVTDQVQAKFVGTGSTALPTGAIGSSAYANTFTVTLRLNAAAGNATSYEWQFDSVSNAFTSVNATLTSTGTTLTFDCNTNNFRSGKTYFVRVRGKNSGSTGPWSTGTNIHRFVNSLHPTQLVSPTGGITRTAFKVWTGQVANATRYYFQVDDDPAFGSPLSLTGFNSYKNETVTGITGNVFRGNYTVGTNPGNIAFDYVAELAQNTTYYVRVRAWNSNQSGYWYTVNNVTTVPTRTATITNVSNGAANQPTGINFIFSDDRNFTETGYDFQLSRDNFVTTDVNVSNQAGRTYFANNLRYNTTYQARVRSYAVGDASPSAWSTINFTTVAAPALSVTFPTNGIELPNVNVYFYSSWQGNIATYEWEVEKLNSPTSSTSASTATYSTNFKTYLVKGGSYRVRVRGVSNQAVTGAWSSWVSFTIAAPLVAPARLGDETITAETAIAFPNPFTSAVTISNPSGVSRGLTVVDAAGKVVLRTRIEGNQANIGQNLQPGIYQVILSEKDGLPAERLKIVRQ